ncbi:MAG: hypothetical protein V1915_02705 [Candidatus Bathyarchaeota archaeon]
MKSLEDKMNKNDFFPLFKKQFTWWLILAISIRFIVLYFFSPITDGFYFTTESVSCILSLKNPYTHTFTTIPANLLTKNSESVFAYLPFVPIFSIPFYLLGEIRYGFILCDIFIGYSIYDILKKNSYKKAKTSCLIYLFLPFTILWTAWAGVNTNIGIAFLMLSILFLTKGDEEKAGVCFGLSLAAIQFSLFLIPFLFFYSFKNSFKKFPLYSIAVCGLITMPFFLSDMQGVIYDILLYNLTRQTLPVFAMASFPHMEFNLSINNFLFTFFGFTIPLFLKITILLPVLILLVMNCADFRKMIANSFIFSTIFLFILPNNLLINYFILPIALGLITDFNYLRKLKIKIK